jgi:carboxypeptidase Q
MCLKNCFVIFSARSRFTGSDSARQRLRELLDPLSAFGAARVDDKWNGNGVDISPMIREAGVPGLLLRHSDDWWYSEYFHLHHSSSDTIDRVDPEALKHNLRVISASVWILANCDEKLRTR